VSDDASTNTKELAMNLTYQTFAVPLAVVLIVCLGCALFPTRGRRGSPEHAGFLGDYSRLAEHPDHPAQEVYLDPQAVWSQYDSIEIDSVTLWVNEGTAKLKDEERQMLTDLVYKALHEKLSQEFRVVDQPGPQTLRLRVALTQAKGAIVPLRTISTIVPTMLVVSSAVGLSADAANTVGSATLEAEIVDSITGRRLAAAVDSRAGTKALLTTRTFQKWGDVEAAANYWAERISIVLVEQGVHRKGG
jgi:hypothetical protein